MRLYSYDGPVMLFDTCIAHRWRGQTYAVSEAKARTNLIYQFKKETGRVPQTKIYLPGKIILEGVNKHERTGISPEFA